MSAHGPLTTPLLSKKSMKWTPPLIPNVLNFANYNSVYQHIDTTDEIDLIGIAIHVHPKAIRGGTPTRGIILTDHTSHPMVLTL